MTAVLPGTALRRCRDLTGIIRAYVDVQREPDGRTCCLEHVALLRAAEALHSVAATHGAGQPIEAVLADMVRDLGLDPDGGATT